MGSKDPWDGITWPWTVGSHGIGCQCQALVGGYKQLNMYILYAFVRILVGMCIPHANTYAYTAYMHATVYSRIRWVASCADVWSSTQPCKADLLEILQHQWRPFPWSGGAHVSRTQKWDPDSASNIHHIGGCTDSWMFMLSHIGAFHSHMHLAAAAPQLPMYLTGPRDFLVFQVPWRSFDFWNKMKHCVELSRVQIVVFQFFLSAKILKWLTPNTPKCLHDILITSGLHIKVRDMLEYVPWKTGEVEEHEGPGNEFVCCASQGGAAVGRETLWWSHSFGQQRGPWNWRIGSHRLYQVTWRKRVAEWLDA